MASTVAHISPYERHRIKQVSHELGHVRRFLSDLIELTELLRDPEMAEDLACISREIERVKQAWEQQHANP